MRPYLERNSANGLTLSSAANLRYLIPFVHGEIKQKIAQMATEICENLDETVTNKIQEQLTQFTTLSELINSKFFEIKATLDKIEATQDKMSAT